MTPTPDVVVVGGGIAGLSVAWELATDLSVLLLEREATPATHATGRSAAILSETYGPDAVCQLASTSRPFLTEPPDGFTPGQLLRSRGMLWVSHQPDSLAGISSRAEQAGVASQRLTPNDACRAVGALRADWVGDALLEPHAMSIDVGALVEGYRTGLLARGGALGTLDPVTRVERHGDRWAVHHRTHTTHCAVVVNAAGAWADDVAAAAGLEPLNLTPLLRSAFLFPAGHPDATHWPLVMDFGGEFYFEPEGDMLLTSPADQTPMPPHDAQADQLAIAKAVDALAAATTLRVRGVRNTWAGLRTFAKDLNPVIGFDPRAEGFFWLAGQGGAGIKTAPAIAQLAKSLILDHHSSTPSINPDGVEMTALHPARLLR